MADAGVPGGVLPAGPRTAAQVLLGLEGLALVVLGWWLYTDELPPGFSSLAQLQIDDLGFLVLILLVAYLLGQLLDILATAMVARLERSPGADTYRAWIKPLIIYEYNREAWLRAQEWIWQSPRAEGEFSQLRFRIMVTKGTALVLLLLAPLLWSRLFGPDKSIGISAALPMAGLSVLVIPFAWLAKAKKLLGASVVLLVVGCGTAYRFAYPWANNRDMAYMVVCVLEPLLVGAFFYAWAISNRLYNALIRDAGEIGSPG